MEIIEPDLLPKGSMLLGSYIMLYYLSTNVANSFEILPTVNLYYYYSDSRSSNELFI